MRFLDWCKRHELLVQIVVSLTTSVLTILWLNGR